MERKWLALVVGDLMKLAGFFALLMGAASIVAEVGNDEVEFGLPPRWLGTIPISPPSVVSKFSQELDPWNRQVVVDFFRTEYLGSAGVPTGWNGNVKNCLAGTTSEAFAEATIRRVNYYRAMAGLPGEVDLDADWGVKCQEAALMMSAEGRLSHHPDPSWACYSPAGAEAAGKSNLIHGRDGPLAIDGYMDDWGAINYHVGHRRWILFPPQKVMGTGSIPLVGGRLGANALWVVGGFGSRPADLAWVAWPPEGYVPYQLLPRVSKRWSFSYPGARFNDATVTMTSFGTNVPVVIEPFDNDAGLADNTLVWIPEGLPAWAPAEDVACRVEIDGVMVDGEPRSFTYTVTIIDPDKPGPAEAPAIVNHPQDQTVAQGGEAVFSVVATGTEPIWYQWWFDGQSLGGQTNATLVLTNVVVAQAGPYHVEVGNSAAVALSEPALLTVWVDPPRFEDPGLESGVVTLRWSGEALLQSAPDPTGPWMDLPDVLSPFSIPTEARARFYRLAQ